MLHSLCNCPGPFLVFMYGHAAPKHFPLNPTIFRLRFTAHIGTNGAGCVSSFFRMKLYLNYIGDLNL